MSYYIGLDVSQRQTAICIIDDKGEKVAEGKALTAPRDIEDWIRKRIEISHIEKVGIEAGAISMWLHRELSRLGLPMICLETYMAHQFLKVQYNKTDKNDARGLAQLVRMGGSFLRPVTIKSVSSQEVRTLLNLRQNLISQRVALENNIAGVMKVFGILTPRGNACATTFHERILKSLDMADERGIDVRDTIMPLLHVYESMCEKQVLLNKKAETLAKSEPICRLLMTAPGVGPIVALSYMSTIDDPRRFTTPNDVGAYFGLTPKQYQSGEIDRKTSTSRRGDKMTRAHLVQAATVLLCCNKKWCPLKAWGIKIAKRHGINKARIAVARKLAIILHRMWIRQQSFCWTSLSADGGLTTQPSSY